MKAAITILLILATQHGRSQTISGQVTDENKAPATNKCTVLIISNVFAATVKTDLRGRYTAEQLVPGSYTISVCYPGYDTMTINGVAVKKETYLCLNTRLHKQAYTCGNIISSYEPVRVENNYLNSLKLNDGVWYYCPMYMVDDGETCPSIAILNKVADTGLKSLTYIIDGEGPVKQSTCRTSLMGEQDRYLLTRNELMAIPATEINDVLSIFPNVYQAKRGGNISVSGARTDENQYILDWMQLSRR